MVWAQILYEKLISKKTTKNKTSTFRGFGFKKQKLKTVFSTPAKY